MTTGERAAQIWVVLIYAAYHRQTISYDVLGKLMGVAPAGIGHWLGPIEQYCLHRKLPPLTSIVVGGTDSDPGAWRSATELRSAQSAVFHHQWLDENPFLPGDLRASDDPSYS